jgi:hypothetical protein
MLHQELVCNIVKNFDSRYLVPLSYKYDAKTWNAAMKEAMDRKGLIRKHEGNMVTRLSSHVHSLAADQISELFILHHILLDRMQEFLQSRTGPDRSTCYSARNRLQKFIDCLDSVCSSQTSAVNPVRLESSKEAEEDLSGQDNPIS